MQTEDVQIAGYGIQYVRIVCCCSVFSFMQVTIERIMQAVGKPVYNMVTGQFVAVLIAVGFFFTKAKEVRINVRAFRPSGVIILKIYQVGIPSIVAQSLASVMTFGMNHILMGFSSTATAVYGIYYKMQSFVYMPLFGLNAGMIPIVAFNYGAKKKTRITKTVLLGTEAAMIIMAAGLLVLQVAPEFLLRQLFDASDEMVVIGVKALRSISWGFLFAAFSLILSAVFQALGNGVYSLLVSLSRQLVIFFARCKSFGAYI